MTEHTWNHRVIRHVTYDTLGYVEDEYYQIHEVHYEDGVPHMVTDDGVAVGGDSIEEIKETLSLMLKATEQPIIDMSYFDNLKMKEDAVEKILHDPSKTFKTNKEFEQWIDSFDDEDNNDNQVVS